MYSVILCGGSGTGLWPLSRKNFPKQFLSLYSDKSLLQETYLRMREIMPMKNIFFVTGTENMFNVLNQIKEVEKEYSKDQIITEPEAKNTAPAVTLAVKHLAEKVKISLDLPIIFLPADHFIGNKEKYLDLVKKAMVQVEGHIGTIGISTVRPETGYGYIRKGEKHPGKNFSQVAEFKEKPDQATAEIYHASEEYLWNSGMYIFSLRTFIQELRKYAPEIYSALTQKFDVFLAGFSKLPSVSLDYAISEKSDNVVVFEGNFDWNDIGSFDSLSEMAPKNTDSKHLSFDSKNVFVHSATGRMVVTLGVEDMNIIETVDSILIQKRGRGEDVKKIVDYLKKYGHKELEHNFIVHRPWGKYEVLIDNPQHKVKKITVYPEAKLSLQSHYHRVEHWVVIKGVAKIVLGEKEIYLRENESTFIPALTRHRLENPGKINLEIIEVQTGSYLEENDITRYDDAYQRT